MSKKTNAFNIQGSLPVGVIEEEATNSEFLIKGIGERIKKGEANFLIKDTSIKDLSVKLKEIEEVLKQRLSSNWVSVRKAFLDLD